jgi:hypothetical protein
MPIDVRMPDGTLVKNVPDNITQADLAARFDAFKAQAATPVDSAAPPQPATGPEGAPIPSILQTQEKPKIETANPLEALVGSTKRYASDIVTGAQLPFDANKATLEGMARQEGITEKSATSLEAVKQAYEKEGFLPAAKEVATQAPAFFAEQAPLIGSMALGARAGAYGGPWGALAGSILLPLLSYSGSSAERKATEQIARGEKVDIDATGAFASGTAMAAIDRLSLGLSGLSKLFGISYKQLGTKAAEKIAKESIGTALVKGTLKTEALEMPNEIAQQVIERYYAGLSLTDADALKEYGEIAYATSLMGPLGGAARLQERSQAKKATTPIPPPVSERIEPEVTPREPSVEVGQPTIAPSPEIEAYDKEIAKAEAAKPTEPTQAAPESLSHDAQAMMDELSGKDVEYIPEEEDKIAEPKPRETIKEFIDRATPEELEDFRQKNAALDMSDEGRRLRAEKEQQEALDEANKILTVLEANKSLAPVQYVQLTEDIKNGDIKSLRDLKDYRKIYDIITNKQAEPEGVITEEEKEFTPVGGRLINKADVEKIGTESKRALEQNLETQEAEKEATLKREIREEKFREPVTQTLSARIVQEGGIARSQKRDMLGETGKIQGYDHVFRENGGDLLTMVKDGLLDDYLPPNIRSTATPPDGLFDARPGYNYISDLIGTGEKVHHYDYEMAKLQHENIVAEKNLAKQYMEPNEAARAAAAEEQEKEYMNVEPSKEVIPNPSETKFREETKTYVSEVPDWYFTDQTPSFKIEMNKLRRRIKQGSIKQEDVIPEIESIYQATKKERPVLDRQRGAAIIKEKLLAAKRRKELSPEMVDMAEWFINQNPDLVQDLAVSIRSNNRDGVAGGYLPLSKLAKIFKYSPNDMTAVHEMLHHMERMLPTDIQDAIRKTWSKSLQKDSERAFGGTNESLKEYYRNVIDYHTTGKKEYEDKAMQMLADNVIPYEHYKNFNPSEFWATKGSEIVQGRYKADISESMVAKIKNWLKEFIETVKGIFNISDDAAVIKALNSLAKSDGKFVTDMIHADTEAYNIKDKTDINTPEFKKWFAGSEVVDKKGNPLEVYHGTLEPNIQEFKPEFVGRTGFPDTQVGEAYFFSNQPLTAAMVAETVSHDKNGRPIYSDKQSTIMPVYLSMENPLVFKAKKYSAEDTIDSYRMAEMIKKAKAYKRDGVIYKTPSMGDTYVVFKPNQIKSVNNKGEFKRTNNNIYANINGTPKNFKGQEVIPKWNAPEESKLDFVLYHLQDKHIDAKRVQQIIEKTGKKIEDDWNFYEKEQLYHGRTASGIRKFLLQEVLPAAKEMQKLNITPEEIHNYLLNRHAEERNIQNNKINPDVYDAKTNKIIEDPLKDQGSGVHTDDARKYLANLDPVKKKHLEEIAKYVDKMTKGTQGILMNSGAETGGTIRQWNKTYKHYVPLMRKEDPSSKTQGMIGTGQGFASRGSVSKRALGSLKEHQDIFGNVIAQRERAIIRAEKIRVGRALYGLAIQNPEPDFWLPVNPDAIRNKKQAVAELKRLGITDAEFIVDNLMAEPKERYLKQVKQTEGTEPNEDFDFDSGLPVNQSKEVVASKVNVMARYKDNVFPVRIDGKDRYIFFNKNNPRAMRMAQAIKNLDIEELGLIESIAGRYTIWFKNVNTQYNPVFGLKNFIRDYSAGNLNLTSTPINGMQAQITADMMPAMRGIWEVLRNERKGITTANTQWGRFFKLMRDYGFQTGYRESLVRNQEEMQIVNSVLEKLNKKGITVNTKKSFSYIAGGLTDFNDVMENSIRLAAAKAALDRGLSPQQAAIIAKNITVNFDKKGAKTRQIGALYAFFNPAVQGTERIYQTLKSPYGKAIIGGGILAGMIQAVMMAMAGYDDEDPPEFTRQKAFVVPMPDGHYLPIPYPQGYNILPNVGRITMDFIINGGKNPGKHVANLTGAIMDSLSPLGTIGWSMQSIAPTALDPFAAIKENRDAFNRPIARLDRDSAPTPGYSRSRDTASTLGKGIAEFLNSASFGDKYVKGAISPTGDQLDFLAGQVGGGLYRETSKAVEYAKSKITGEEVPAYRVPIVGQFHGEVGQPAAIANKFYQNVIRMTDHENTIKGLKEDKLPKDEYMAKYPEAKLWHEANTTENRINQINKQKREDIKKNKPKEVIQRHDDKKTRIMKEFNDKVKRLTPD